VVPWVLDGAVVHERLSPPLQRCAPGGKLPPALVADLHWQHVKYGDAPGWTWAWLIVFTTGMVQISVPPTTAPRRIRSLRDMPIRRRICPSRCSSIAQPLGGRPLLEQALRGGDLPGWIVTHVNGLGDAWKQYAFPRLAQY